MNATAKLLSESALRVFECEFDGCKAVAIRGAYCVEHCRICDGCGCFCGPADLKDGVCARCIEDACEYELEEYVSAVCTCGSSKPSHVARKAVR